MRRGGGGGELLVFFCFVSSAMLSLALCGSAYAAEQELGELCACLLFCLLLSAAHSCSCWGHILLPAGTALLGAVSACASWAIAGGSKQGDESWLGLLALLLAAVPVQFFLAVQSISLGSSLLRYRRSHGKKLSLPDIMSWASMGVLAAIVSIVLLR